MDHTELKIIRVPDGQTENSFLESKISQLKRICQLSSPIINDVNCFDEYTQKEINHIFDTRLLQLLERFEEAKNNE